MGGERQGRVPVILLPETLRRALGEEASRDLVEVINAVVGASQDRILDRMERGFAELRAEMAKMKTELREEMAHMKAGLREEMAVLRGEVESKVSRAEARLIKWAFAFWASGVTALIVAILLK